MKDFIAIIGATAVIGGATAFAIWGSSSTGENSTDEASSSAPIQQVSVPVSDLPEANGQSLKSDSAAIDGGKTKKPVITIEEIDPQDRKQSIKAKLEEAKAIEAKKAEAKKAEAKKAEAKAMEAKKA